MYPIIFSANIIFLEQNKSETNTDFERLPASPLGMTNEDLDRIHRKPPKFEILHRFKPGSRSHAKRKSKAFGRPSVCTEVGSVLHKVSISRKGHIGTNAKDIGGLKDIASPSRDFEVL